MSESNKPRGGKAVARPDCRRAVDILIDEPGDTTRRPRRPNVPLDPPPPRRPEPDPRDKKPQEPS
jgi:hypothetical protein